MIGSRASMSRRHRAGAVARTRTPRRAGTARIVSVVLALALAATALAGCGLGKEAAGYQVTITFERAIGLFPGSAVKLLGVDVGNVTRVEVVSGGVEVDLRIDHDVPLPPDVRATYVALSLIGERNVILAPAWKPGQERVGDGHRIPLSNTSTPVEPDEGLEAFKQLADGIDPATLTALISGANNAFSTDPQAFNRFLGTAADLTGNLSRQDDRIIEAAENLHQFTQQLVTREAQLGQLITSFSETSSTLAAERDNIASLLDNSVKLVDSTTGLVAALQQTLPYDLAALAKLGETVKANDTVFEELFSALPHLAQGIANAFDPVAEVFRLDVGLIPEIAYLMDQTLGRLLRAIGIGCLPLIGPVLGLC